MALLQAGMDFLALTFSCACQVSHEGEVIKGGDRTCLLLPT